MNKKIIINIATASFFLIGAILIGVGIYLLAPSGEQSKLCFDVKNPNAPAKATCPTDVLRGFTP